MKELAIDDIRPVLNVARAYDLRVILAHTPTRLRVDVALAFAELTGTQAANAAGFHLGTVIRWLSKENKMPFGAAFRIAKVFGVPAEELLEEWL